MKVLQRLEVAVIKNNRILKCLLMMVVSLLLVLSFSIGVSASNNHDRQEADAYITISQRLSVKTSYGKSIHNTKGTDFFLPDEFYNKNLPRQVSPGTKYLPKYDEVGNVKQIKMYDDYGREIGWIDYTNHGYGNIISPDYHTVPHWHERVYDAINPDGMKIHHRTDVNTPLGDK